MGAQNFQLFIIIREAKEDPMSEFMSDADKYIRERLGDRLADGVSIEKALQRSLKQFIEAKDYLMRPPKGIPTKMDACDDIAVFAEARPDLITDTIQDYLVQQFDSCNEATHLVILRILSILKATRHISFFEKIISEKRWHEFTTEAAIEGLGVIQGRVKIAPDSNFCTRWNYNEFRSELPSNDPSHNQLTEDMFANWEKNRIAAKRDFEKNDRDNQLRDLRAIFDGALLAPKFKHSKKYNTKSDEGCPFIRYSDIKEHRYIIRRGGRNFYMDSLCDKETEVIAIYGSLEQLIDDGWRLD